VAQKRDYITMRESYAGFFGSPSAFRLDTAWLALRERLKR